MLFHHKSYVMLIYDRPANSNNSNNNNESYFAGRNDNNYENNKPNCLFCSETASSVQIDFNNWFRLEGRGSRKITREILFRRLNVRTIEWRLTRRSTVTGCLEATNCLGNTCH